MSQQKIKLDVGGVKITTNRSTLEIAPVLKMIVERDFKDESTKIFLDSDAKIFEHVLNYLRDSNYVIPKKYIDNTHNMLGFFGLVIKKEPIPKDIVCYPKTDFKNYDIKYNSETLVNVAKFFTEKSKLLDLRFSIRCSKYVKIIKLNLIISDDKKKNLNLSGSTHHLYFKNYKINITEEHNYDIHYKSTKYLRKTFNYLYQNGNPIIYLEIQVDTHHNDKSFPLYLMYEY